MLDHALISLVDTVKVSFRSKFPVEVDNVESKLVTENLKGFRSRLTSTIDSSATQCFTNCLEMAL